MGYIGNINELLDIELLSRIADSYPSGSLIPIGKLNGRSAFLRGQRFKRFLPRPNVYYWGFKNYVELPGYLKAFDICLLPFRLCEWMRNSSPNKIYQYLASGKPIVSTDFPAVREVENVVYAAPDRESFQRFIAMALEENDQNLYRQRIKTAMAYSMVEHARQKIDIIIRHFKSAQLPSD